MFNTNTMVTIHTQKNTHSRYTKDTKESKHIATKILSDHKERQDKKKRTTKTENA